VILLQYPTAIILPSLVLVSIYAEHWRKIKSPSLFISR